MVMVSVFIFVSLRTSHSQSQLQATQTKNLTPEQKQQIINECVENHISPMDLAKKWGCNPDTIRSWVRKAGKTLPKTYKKTLINNEAPGYDYLFFILLFPLILFSMCMNNLCPVESFKCGSGVLCPLQAWTYVNLNIIWCYWKFCCLYIMICYWVSRYNVVSHSKRSLQTQKAFSRTG